MWIGPTNIESLTRKLDRVRDVVIMAMGGFFFDGRDASWIADAGGSAVLRHEVARKTLSSLWQHEQTNMLALCRTGMRN